MGSRRGANRVVATAVAVLAATIALVGDPIPSAPAAGAEVVVPGTGVAHPRVLHDPGAEDVLRDRLTRDPSRSVFLAMHARANAWDDRTLGDPSIAAQRDLTRAAKVRAFEYVLDRTVVEGEIVAFPTPASRQAAGGFVRDVLLQVYDRSRLAVPAPIGGWDRDISTSEEIVNAVVAFDLLLGSDFALLPADRATIVGRIERVTDELHRNFVDPDTAGGYTRLHQNNHRTKSGAAMALAAIVLADDLPPAQTRRWFDTGVDYIDDGLRHMLVTGDGAYAEGTHYWSFTLQNLLPLLNAWERLLGGASWTTADGLVVPALARHPLLARTQRWMIDVSLPDGSLAPFDDATVRRGSYGGALPATLPAEVLAASRWRWANQPQRFETNGNVELGPDAIAAYDDAVAPSMPSWAPTQFYVEGGTASLRGSWDPEATMALVLGEHGTASQWSRDRTGIGRWPQSHEHPDPGSFLLQAFGEDLAIDPGYLTFATHGAVNQAEHHNVVLVDGKGPSDYLQASLAWGADPWGPPPAEGQSTITATLDSSSADVATVVSDYLGTAVERRFLFGGDRYLVVSDDIDPYGAPDASLTWPLHGNGGETSGGTYESGTAGGTWTFGKARLTTAIAVPGEVAALTTRVGVHESPGGVRRTHTVLDASAPGSSGGAVQVLYPSRVTDAAPTITTSAGGATPWVRVEAPADDRRLSLTRPPSTPTPSPDEAARASAGPATIDGVVGGDGLLVVDRRTDGTLRSAWTDEATSLAVDGGPRVSVDAPGSLGLSFDDPASPTTAEVVATGTSHRVTVSDLGFVPATVDGACGFDVDARTGAVTIDLNRERRVVLRKDAGDARPASDAGWGGRSTPGAAVELDGTASCDAEDGAVTHAWELVSAPAGSAWRLDDPNSPRPTLHTDVVGPYRVRLTVTDGQGNRSLEQEVVVIAGPRCGDGVDNDLDGRIDTVDPDCDGPDDPPPSTTTTTTSSSTSTTTTSTSTPMATTTTAPGPTTTGVDGPGSSTTTRPTPTTDPADIDGTGRLGPRPARAPGASPIRARPVYTG